MTGGHAGSTAYAVIKEIVDQGLDWQLYFVGGKSSVEGKKAKTLHSVTLPNTKVKYKQIITGRIQRKFTRWTIPSLLKIPIGFIQSLYLLVKLKPDIILSFGGYAAFPVVVTGWILRKKIILHEQTTAAGRANIYSAYFADVIALSRKSSLRYFPEKKCKLVGNPISPEVSKITPKKKKSSPPVIFVTGGASGSKIINNTLDEILEELLKNFVIIHQTGDLQFDYFIKRKSHLGEKLHDNYEVYNVIPSFEWPEYMRRSDIIVSRSGANMVSELMSTKRPCVLIPLKIAYLDEQYKNAVMAVEYGIAKLIKEELLDGNILKKNIMEVNNNWDNIINKIRSKKAPDKDAGINMVKLIKDNL